VYNFSFCLRSVIELIIDTENLLSKGQLGSEDLKYNEKVSVFVWLLETVVISLDYLSLTFLLSRQKIVHIK